MGNISLLSPSFLVFLFENPSPLSTRLLISTDILNSATLLEDLYNRLDGVFAIDPLMLRTFATLFSPNHLSYYQFRLPLEVVLANLYYHMRNLSEFPVAALQVCLRRSGT